MGGNAEKENRASCADRIRSSVMEDLNSMDVLSTNCNQQTTEANIMELHFLILLTLNTERFQAVPLHCVLQELDPHRLKQQLK